MKNISIGILFLLCTSVQAQLFLEVYEDSYVPLSNPQMLTYGVWDDPELYIPLGFDFQFFDQEFNTLYSFYGYHNELHSNISQDSTISIFLPLFADLIDPGILSGESLSSISFTTEGEAPFRICKIQWQNCAFYNEGEAYNTYNDRVNFQMWLYETENTIEYHYGENTILNADIDFDTNGFYIGMIKGLHLSMEYNEQIDQEWHLIGNSSYLDIGSGFTFSNDIYQNLLLLEFPNDGTVLRFETDGEFTSVENQTDDFSATVFPTVFADEFFIQSKSNASFSLFDLAGNKVISGKINLGKNSVSIPSIESGIYFLQIFDEDVKKTFKLVKK